MSVPMNGALVSRHHEETGRTWTGAVPPLSLRGPSAEAVGVGGASPIRGAKVVPEEQLLADGLVSSAQLLKPSWLSLIQCYQNLMRL